MDCKHHVREFIDLYDTTSTGFILNLLGIHRGDQYTSSDLVTSGNPVIFPESRRSIFPEICYHSSSDCIPRLWGGSGITITEVHRKERITGWMHGDSPNAMTICSEHKPLSSVPLQGHTESAHTLPCFYQNQTSNAFPGLPLQVGTLTWVSSPFLKCSSLL